MFSVVGLRRVWKILYEYFCHNGSQYGLSTRVLLQSKKGLRETSALACLRRYATKFSLLTVLFYKLIPPHLNNSVLETVLAGAQGC